MAQYCVQLGACSEGLSYRDLKCALEGLFTQCIIQQTSILSMAQVIQCIHERAQAMPRDNSERFFRQPTDTHALAAGRQVRLAR